MTDHDNHRDDRPTTREPARGPVIDTRDLPPSEGPQAEAEARPMIASSLVGEGGLPAATRREGAPGPAGIEGDVLHLDEGWRPLGDDAASGRDDAEAARPPGGEAVTRGLDDAAGTTGDDSVTGRTAGAPMHEVAADQGTEAASGPFGETAYAPVSPAGPVPPPARRGGFWPLALGGALAAGLGVGVTWFAMPHQPVPVTAGAGLSPEALAEARASAAEAARGEIETRSAALTEAARTAGAEAGSEAGAEAAAAAAREAIAAAPQPAAAATDTAALDRQAARIGTLESKLAALTAAPAAAPGAAPQPGTAPAGTAPDALAALQAEVKAQAARLDELAARPTLDPAAADEVRRLAAEAETARQAIAAAGAEVDARITAAGEQADAVTGRVDDLARRLRDTAALTALQSALVNGSDGVAASAQLQAAGVQPPPALAQPIPPLADLQRDFPQAARAGLRAALRDGAAAGEAGSGLASFLRVQTGARSVTPRSGSDPDAVLSRAQAAVTGGDIGAALAEVAALPEPARVAMEGWIAPATAWSAAESAVQDATRPTNAAAPAASGAPKTSP